MKEFLKKLIKEKENRAEELRKQIKESASADEVRALGETLNAVLEELQAAKEQLEQVKNEGEEEQPANESENQRSAVPMQLNPIATYGSASRDNQQRNDDPHNTLEYRTGFMNFVCRGVPIPVEVRADANTKTTDAASVIPTVLVDRIIEKMDNVGMILPLITKTSYAAGVEIPTSAVKPVASWVSEGAGSDRQKKTTGKITFSYYKLRCEISMSMEVGAMALSAFEAKFVENVANAMTKAIEKAVISGSGSSQPKGILKETPATGQAITVAKAGKLTYKLLCDAEAALPEEYEGSAKWCMSKATFMGFMSMTDTNGQPIARINYGLGGKPERTLLGREVVTASDYMGSYADTVTEDTIFAFIFDFSDYVLNTIYDMGISKKQDWDTEDLLTKAVMSVDGKAVSTDSLVTITKTVA